jgi:hypothetical protein
MQTGCTFDLFRTRAEVVLATPVDEVQDKVSGIALEVQGGENGGKPRKQRKYLFRIESDMLFIIYG